MAKHRNIGCVLLLRKILNMEAADYGVKWQIEYCYWQDYTGRIIWRSEEDFNFLMLKTGTFSFRKLMKIFFLKTNNTIVTLYSWHHVSPIKVPPTSCLSNFPFLSCRLVEEDDAKALIYSVPMLYFLIINVIL